MPERASTVDILADYAPPIILGSAYGYRALTRISPGLARVMNAYAHVVANPEADLSGLDEDTVLAILEGREAMKEIVREALYYWNGMLDARCGTKDSKAPQERGGVYEIQYLRGFIDGHLGEHAPKYDFQARAASRSPVPALPGDAVTFGVAAQQQNHAAQLVDDDQLSVHSAGTDLPMPNTPFLSMAALLGYDERDGSPTSFQRYVMDQAQYPNLPGNTPNNEATIERDAAAVGPQRDPLGPRNFAPVPRGTPPRPARHLCPWRGPFEARAIPEIPLPEGVDRVSIAQDWDPDQRSALFEYDGEIAWMESEDKDHPADAHLLAEAFRALAATIFPGESPPRPVIPFVNSRGIRPHSIAVIGTVHQVDHLVSTGTWATSWVCAQFFPNHPRPLRFVCTFGGLQLRLHEYEKAERMIRSAMEKSDAVASYMRARGLILAPTLDTMEVQHLQITKNGEPQDLWNVVMTPPTDDPTDQTTWRLTVAGIRPSDPFKGELSAHTHPFKCRTCGCLTHPRSLCPTATAPGWTGSIPRWGVRKSLWGRREAPSALATVRIRATSGKLVRADNATRRPAHKIALSKKRKAFKAAPRSSLGYRRPVHFV